MSDWLSGMLGQMRRADNYVKKLHQITKRASPQPANLSGEDTCQRSGVCCWRRPCDLHPGDVERLAAYLNISIKETFRQYLRVDQIGSKYRLLPRRGGQSGGTWVTAEETYDIDTPCVFLDQPPGGPSSCRVQEAKPTGGAAWTCTMSESEANALPDPEWTREALMALGWDGEEDDY